MLRARPWIGSEGHWRHFATPSHKKPPGLLTSFGLKTPQDLPGGAEISYGGGAASQNTASTVSDFKDGDALTEHKVC